MVEGRESVCVVVEGRESVFRVYSVMWLCGYDPVGVSSGCVGMIQWVCLMGVSGMCIQWVYQVGVTSGCVW